LANNGVDIFEVMSSILEDYDGDEVHEKTRERLLSNEKTRERLSSSEKTRERLSSSGSSETTGTGPIRNDNLQRAKSVKDRWKETKAPTSKL
jgi:hypothetical protein